MDRHTEGQFPKAYFVAQAGFPRREEFGAEGVENDALFEEKMRSFAVEEFGESRAASMYIVHA